jgi:site-specific recombinase XerD
VKINVATTKIQNQTNSNSNSYSFSIQGASFMNFINTIRSPKTKEAYETSLRRYLNHIKKTSIDDLLVNAASNPRYIESQIIDYIVSLRESGVGYKTMEFLIAPIFTFYQLNDVVLNRKKVSRYLGEYKRVVRDQAYTTEQIHSALQTADIRMRLILLILCSTGARVGSLPDLVLGNLTKLPAYGIYRIVFYEGTNHEYYTFTTREAAQTGIDNYLFFRQRCGEKIAFDDKTCKWEPFDTPLIRRSFDVNDMLQVRNPRPLFYRALRQSLTTHLVKSGLRQVEHPTATVPNSSKRVRKPVSLATGFSVIVLLPFQSICTFYF